VPPGRIIRNLYQRETPDSHGSGLSRLRTLTAPDSHSSGLSQLRTLTAPDSHSSGLSQLRTLTAPDSHGSGLSRLRTLTAPDSHSSGHSQFRTVTPVFTNTEVLWLVTDSCTAQNTFFFKEDWFIAVSCTNVYMSFPLKLFQTPVYRRLLT